MSRSIRPVALFAAGICIATLAFSVGTMTHTMAMTDNEQGFGGLVGWLGPVAAIFWAYALGWCSCGIAQADEPEITERETLVFPPISNT